MDHCEGGWVALWGGIVVPDVHFLCQPWSLGKDIAGSRGCPGFPEVGLSSNKISLYKLDVARCNSHYLGHKALWPSNVFGGSFGREQQGAEGHLVLLL